MIVYGYLFYCGFELLDVSRNDYDVGTFFGELYGYAFAHAFRSTCDEDCLGVALSANA